MCRAMTYRGAQSASARVCYVETSYPQLSYSGVFISSTLYWLYTESKKYRSLPVW